MMEKGKKVIHDFGHTGTIVTGNIREHDQRILVLTDEGDRMWWAIERITLIPPKMKWVRNLMSGKKVQIPEDTPLCCDPSSDTYWSM
jgi:hypothetical protein